MLLSTIKAKVWAHHLAVLALLFLSLAPTISRLALAGNVAVDFQPSICTSTKQSITIEVLTTKGQRLKTTFATEPMVQQTPERNLVLHLEHCPYCAINADDHWLALIPIDADALSNDADQLWQITPLSQLLPSSVDLGFSSRAPPVLS